MKHYYRIAVGLFGFTPPTNRPVTPPTLPWQALVAILFASVLLHQGKALGQQPSSAPSEMHVVSDVQGGETSESEEFDWNDLDELLNLSVVNPASETGFILEAAFQNQTPQARVADSKKEETDGSLGDVDSELNELLGMSLDQLNNSPISAIINQEMDVASFTAKPFKKQPGIVSVMNREEIRSTGARDLIDILRLIPGFDFGQDVVGVVGPSVRGLWGFDGKILLIVDGIEYNDLLYGTIQLGRHFPADLIQKIEIIRGPGSVIYGGNAELAVIKITTVGAELDGFGSYNTVSGGAGDWGDAHQIAFGRAGDQYKISFSASYINDRMSNQIFTDSNGDQLDLTSNSRMEPYNFNLGGEVHGVEGRLIYDQYIFDQQTSYGELESELHVESFTSTLASLRKEFVITDSLTITPAARYTRQVPWAEREKASGFPFYKITATRMLYDLRGAYTPDEYRSFVLGAEYYEDAAHADDIEGDEITWFAGNQEIHYYNTSVYSEYSHEIDDWDATVGGRFVHHNVLGDAFVPRVALIRSFGKSQLKALYTQAYRTPNIENFNFGTNLKAETTTAYELEGSHQFSDNMWMTANVFHVRIDDVIVFDVVNSVESYHNFPAVSSYGIETEVKIIDEWGHANFGYSLYQADTNTVGIFQTPEDTEFLGLAAHKFMINTQCNLSKNSSINFNGTAYSSRWGFSFMNGGVQLAKLDPQFIGNLYWQYKRGNWTCGMGIADLFNEKVQFVQPYDGGGMPLPSKEREVFFKLSYGR